MDAVRKILGEAEVIDPPGEDWIRYNYRVPQVWKYYIDPVTDLFIYFDDGVIVDISEMIDNPGN